MIAWPAAGTRMDCWCGAPATVAFRTPRGPSDNRPPVAQCPAGHNIKLPVRHVAPPREDPTGPPLFVIVRAGTTLAQARDLVVGAALERAGHNVKAAAADLGLTGAALYQWIRRHRARPGERPGATA